VKWRNARYLQRLTGEAKVPESPESLLHADILALGGNVTNLVELRKDERARAIASIQQYFEENLTEPIGNLPAGQLLDYFMEEIGPVIYNRAISEAQVRLQQRVMDLNGELFADEFQFWVRKAAKRRSQK
jgi:uncharacterized protein (DUF2164 family)